MNIQPININNQVQFKSLELRRTINICTHKDLFKKKVRYMYQNSLLGRFIDFVDFLIKTAKQNRLEDIEADRKPKWRFGLSEYEPGYSDLNSNYGKNYKAQMGKVITLYPEDIEKLDKAISGEKVADIDTTENGYVHKYFENLKKNKRYVEANYLSKKNKYCIIADGKKILLNNEPYVYNWSEIKFTPEDEEYIKSFPTRKEQVARMLELIDKGRNINKENL